MNDPPRRTEVDLPGEVASVPAGRHFVCALLAAWGLDDVLDTAGLLVTELVTNAVRHAGTRVHVTVDGGPPVTVTVTDRRPDRLPLPLPDDPAAEGGRGLALVAALSDGWGVHRTAADKSVWFTLADG